MSRFGPQLLNELRQILKDQCGRDYTSEELQQAGMSIIRFMIAKRERVVKKSNAKGNVHEYEKLASKKSTSK